MSYFTYADYHKVLKSEIEKARDNAHTKDLEINRLKFEVGQLEEYKRYNEHFLKAMDKYQECLDRGIYDIFYDLKSAITDMKWNPRDEIARDIAEMLSTNGYRHEGNLRGLKANKLFEMYEIDDEPIEKITPDTKVYMVAREISNHPANRGREDTYLITKFCGEGYFMGLHIRKDPQVDEYITDDLATKIDCKMLAWTCKMEEPLFRYDENGKTFRELAENGTLAKYMTEEQCQKYFKGELSLRGTELEEELEEDDEYEL